MFAISDQAHDHSAFGSFQHRLRVRYSEIDGQNIVFNAHYLTYLDIAVTEYFRAILGEHWMKEYEDRFNIVLRHADLSFIRPAMLDDWLDIGCRASRLGNSSVTVKFAVVRQNEPDQPLLEAEIVYVNIDAKSGQPCAIPPDVRAEIVAFERANGNEHL